MFRVRRPIVATLGVSGAVTLVATVCAGNFAVGGPESEGPPLNGPTARQGVAWEYKAIPRAEIAELAPGKRGEYITPQAVMGDLNRGLGVLGDEGWELVAVEPYHTEGYVRWPSLYVFRRPK